MTTGRINQVTIVRRGWPTDACEGAGEISKLLITPGGAPAEALLARACSAAQGDPLFPSHFPRAPSAALTEGCSLGAPRGGPAHGGKPPCSVASCCSFVDLTSGQLSTEPIRGGQASLTATGIPSRRAERVCRVRGGRPCTTAARKRVAPHEL
jgi:hypothetical protein